MAGDTGSPQCQPTDLSMKSRRNVESNNIEKIETYDYDRENTGNAASSWQKLNDMAISYYFFTRETEKRDQEFVHKKRKAVTPGPETMRGESIMPALRPLIKTLTPTSSGNLSRSMIKTTVNALTHTLTPTASSCIRTVQGGNIIQTPLSDDDAPLVFKIAKTEPTTPVGGRNTSPNPTIPEIQENADISPPPRFILPKDQTSWRFPVLDRPNHLDLRQVSYVSSPDCDQGSTKTTYGVAAQHALAEVMASPPETPGVTTKPVQKRRKRKLGPGRGWKFHDLSNDGGVNKKRTYAHNKLENEILQRFQDRVCVKTMPMSDGSKDKLILVEPSDIVDCDLVRCGSGLRLLFDKEAGTYKLQLLPYTLEEGPLSDQDRVMQAVSKMLAENNEVLCPSAYASLLRTGNSVIIGEESLEGSGVLPRLTPEQQYPARRKPTVIAGKSKQNHELQSPVQNKEPIENQRNRLLWSLNNDLTRNNNALVGASAAGRKICQMWHTPQMVQLPGRGGKKFTPVSKWCANCRGYR